MALRAIRATGLPIACGDTAAPPSPHEPQAPKKPPLAHRLLPKIHKSRVCPKGIAALMRAYWGAKLPNSEFRLIQQRDLGITGAVVDTGLHRTAGHAADIPGTAAAIGIYTILTAIVVILAAAASR